MGLLERPALVREGRGFTLVEVIIALALMSMIMLGLTAALQSLGATYGRTTERADHVSEMRLVSQYLRQFIGEAAPIFSTSEEGGNPFFNGGERELVFVGNFAGYQGPGGLHFVRLYHDESADQLKMSYLPFQEVPPVEGIQWEVAREHLLVTGLTGFRLSYLENYQEQAWAAQWQDPDVLPLAVSLRIEVDGRAWPELVIWLGGSRRAFM